MLRDDTDIVYSMQRVLSAPTVCVNVAGLVVKLLAFVSDCGSGEHT